MYNFALKDCLYHLTCKRRLFGKHRKSEHVLPHKSVSLENYFELWLGFENIKMYTLQALWERYTDFLLAMGKHMGYYETIEPRIPGELQFVIQLNPREPL